MCAHTAASFRTTWSREWTQSWREEKNNIQHRKKPAQHPALQSRIMTPSQILLLLLLLLMCSDHLWGFVLEQCVSWNQALTIILLALISPLFYCSRRTFLFELLLDLLCGVLLLLLLFSLGHPIKYWICILCFRYCFRKWCDMHGIFGWNTNKTTHYQIALNDRESHTCADAVVCFSSHCFGIIESQRQTGTMHRKIEWNRNCFLACGHTCGIRQLLGVKNIHFCLLSVGLCWVHARV